MKGQESIISTCLAMLGVDLRVVQITWTVFLTGFSLYLVFAIRSTLLLIVFAVFFVYVVFALTKLADRATMGRLPRPVILFLVYAVLSVSVVVFVIVIGNRIADEASRLMTQLPQMLDPKIIVQRVPLPSFLEGERDRISTFIVTRARVSAEQLSPFAQQLGKSLWHGVGGLVDIVLIPIVGFFLTKDALDLQKKSERFLGQLNNTYWANVASKLNAPLASYVGALALLAIITFVCYGVALS